MISPKLLIITGVACMLTLTGCVHRHPVKCRIITSTTSGPSWIETATVEECVRRGGRVIEGTTTIDTIRCVDRKGFPVPAESAQDCINKKGKVIEESAVREKTFY